MALIDLMRSSQGPVLVPPGDAVINPKKMLRPARGRSSPAVGAVEIHDDAPEGVSTGHPVRFFTAHPNWLEYIPEIDRSDRYVPGAMLHFSFFSP